MLVQDRRVDARPVHDIATVAHGERQGHTFVDGQPLEEDSHGERGHLAFRDRAVCQTLDEELDLRRVQRSTVALLSDEFLRQHLLSFLKPSQ